MSVLPVVLKIFEKVKLMRLHANHFLSLNLFGCRKGFSMQQAFLTLIEKWKNVWDRKGYAGGR